jgi:thiol-disulfide isomerase/thioredoxin
MSLASMKAVAATVFFLALPGLAEEPKAPPAKDVKPAAAQAKPKAWLGIMFTDVPLQMVPQAYAHPSPEGAVRIQQVIKGASAFQAGLKEEDFILAINGTPLKGRKTLLDTVQSKPVGAIVELKIGRDGKAFTQKMALSPRPEDMQNITRMLVGSDAIELDGKYYSQDAGSLAKNRGKVVLLDFWATWCGPCRATIPGLDALYRKYKGKGLEIIGVSSENLDELKAFNADGKQGYPLFNDVSALTTRKYQAFAYPTMVLIDRKGVIQRVEVGAHPADQMEKWILELL